MDFPNILKLVMYSKYIDMHVEEFLFFTIFYGQVWYKNWGLLFGALKNNQ